MTIRFGIAVAGVLSVTTASGCLLTAAGIVEVTKPKPKPDPMGTEYLGVDGDIGWYEAPGRADVRAGTLVAGMHAIGCAVDLDYIEGTYVPCPKRPKLALSFNDKLVFRLCAPGTERMQCRMAWEAVHGAIRIE